ncbi:MAG TPA: hypothetical protein VFW35_04455 [Sphingomicrobium sp.]|nr:hypothetical protein [Sphingomicrobium sp.]
MYKSLIALAIIGAMSVPAEAQTAPAVQPPRTMPVANQAQPAPPQMVKKTVCEENDNPYSHISRICHTVMVPAPPAQPTASNPPAPTAPRYSSAR